MILDRINIVLTASTGLLLWFIALYFISLAMSALLERKLDVRMLHIATAALGFGVGTLLLVRAAIAVSLI
jgi:hypothetical protein